jgi:hypothetical protein
LHLLDQRIESYALFPEVSLQKPIARRRRHAAPADRAERKVIEDRRRVEVSQLDVER